MIPSSNKPRERYNLFTNLGQPKEGKAADRRPPPPPRENLGIRLLYPAFAWLLPDKMTAHETTYKEIKLLSSKFNMQRGISRTKAIKTSITPSCNGNRRPRINRTCYTLDVYLGTASSF